MDGWLVGRSITLVSSDETLSNGPPLVAQTPREGRYRSTHGAPGVIRSHCPISSTRHPRFEALAPLTFHTYRTGAHVGQDSYPAVTLVMVTQLKAGMEGGSSNAGTVLYASSRGFKRVVVSLAGRGWDGMMRRLLMVLSIPSRNGPILVLVTERQTMCETTRLVLKLCVMWQDEKRWLARLVGHPRCERETGDVRRLCGG